MTAPRTTRASKVPLLLECARSAESPEVEIDDSGDPAIGGTVSHDSATGYIDTGAVPDYHDDELRLLFNCFRRMWDDDLKPYFPHPMTEQDLSFEIGGVKVRARGDVIDVFDTAEGLVINVLDLKFGRVEVDAKPQTRTYACGVAAAFPDRPIHRVTVFTAWVRSMTWEPETFDGRVLREHLRRIEEQLSAENPPYRSGEHCRWCKRRHECPARLALVRDALALAKSGGGLNLREFTPDGVATVAAGAKMLADMGKALDSWLREEIKAAGPLPLPGGDALDLVPQDRRATTEAAAPFVRERFGIEALEAIAKLSVGDIERLATDAADRKVRGSVKAAKEAVAQDLQEAGAITTRTSLILKRVPVEAAHIEGERHG